MRALLRRAGGFWRDNALGLTFFLAFLAALAGQAVAGHAQFDQQLAVDGLPPVGFWEYVAGSDFAVDVAENWQSEYLQFFLYLFLTIWLVQRGSPESKPPDRVGRESDRDQLVGPHARTDSPRWAHRHSGFAGRLYANSLGIVMCAIFVASWFVQSVAGTAAYNEERLRRLQPPVTWADYLGSPDFWSRTLQNWQSEFLAVASMAVLSVYLRQRGSPESKPVGAAHGATGVEG